ncbi:Ppx/GppA family phosphatase [Flavisphingomonas formosensis]|uniref:Ppx/GppA family phosphatase n=1 Tax=Flavisphingomonas formosensis TaxID=861534 RepID=UPI0012F977B4|nr:Ppx/GppA family phosphatase [Sphingomonas formosensis]
MSTVTLLRRRDEAELRASRLGIIDIGSNSIRLVVYDGPARIPSILFNEKVLAGLGRGLAQTGALDPQAVERALSALSRYRCLADQMRVGRLRTVATAAVRDASNGPQFLDRLRDEGFEVELLSGGDEARMAGHGVLSAIPDANGIVGDLGGGSLELVRVAGGKIHERASFPLGVLRIDSIRRKGQRALERTLAKALDQAGFKGMGKGLPFYMVGGSWRAVARLDMHLTDYPLPIVHHYRMAPDSARRLVRVLAHIDRKRLREVPGLSVPRIPDLANASLLLALLTKQFQSSEMVVSAYGLREGLIHSDLADHIRDQDPLIVATREEGRMMGRFPEHGDLLDRWIAPLFAGESVQDARLRHATCQLADVGWHAHPEFRAERGLDVGLHGNWVGVDARGRAMIGQALYVSFGGSGMIPVIAQLCTPDEIARAERWGLAMRLGQRLSGGVAEPLQGSRLVLRESGLVLHLDRGDLPLYGEAVERRHKALATAFGLRAVMMTD